MPTLLVQYKTRGASLTLEIAPRSLANAHVINALVAKWNEVENIPATASDVLANVRPDGTGATFSLEAFGKSMVCIIESEPTGCEEVYLALLTATTFRIDSVMCAALRGRAFDGNRKDLYPLIDALHRLSERNV